MKHRWAQTPTQTDPTAAYDATALTDATAYARRLLQFGGPDLRRNGGFERLVGALTTLYGVAGGAANVSDLCLLYPYLQLGGPSVLTLRGTAPVALAGSYQYARGGLVFNGSDVRATFTLPTPLPTVGGGSVAITWRGDRSLVQGSDDTVLSLTNGTSSYTAGSMMYLRRNQKIYQFNHYYRSAATQSTRMGATFDKVGSQSLSPAPAKTVRSPGVYGLDLRPHTCLFSNDNAASPVINVWSDGLISDSFTSPTAIPSPVAMDKLTIGALTTGAASWGEWSKGTMGAWAAFTKSNWTDDEAKGVDAALAALDPALSGALGIIALGDSITGRLFATQFDGYLEQLLQLLGQPDIACYNQAYSGASAENMAIDVWLYLGHRCARHDRCHVIVAGGINDIILNSRTDVQVMGYLRTQWQAARVLGAKVHAVTLTPLDSNAYWTAQRDTYRKAVNAAIRAAYAAGEVDYLHDVEALPEMKSAPDTTYFSDALHPTAAGNLARARLMLRNLGPETWIKG